MELADVGKAAEALPRVKRKGSQTRPAWYVDDRLLVRQLDETSVVVRSNFGARERLLDDHPGTFGVPPRYERHMMVVVELWHADPVAVGRALREAWELQSRV